MLPRSNNNASKHVGTLFALCTDARTDNSSVHVCLDHRLGAIVIQTIEGMAGMSFGLTEPTDATSCDLKRRIMIFLSQRGVSSPQRLNIEVSGGTVTLHGTVGSFSERQLCHCCKHVAGVLHLVDELKVELPSSTPRAALN